MRLWEYKGADHGRPQANLHERQPLAEKELPQMKQKPHFHFIIPSQGKPDQRGLSKISQSCRATRLEPAGTSDLILT